MHVVDSLGVGGMERVLIDVANNLDAQRFKQSFCCISRLGAAAPRVKEGIRCFDLGKGDERALLMPLKIARLLQQEKPDVIHTQSWAGVDGVLANTLTRGARLVHSEHGRNVPYLNGEPVKRKLARRAIYHLADVVFTISEELRDYYARETGFAAARMRVIPNGVDVRRFAAAEANGVREELNLTPADRVIGTVARFDATKDLGTLLRAFAQLQPTSNVKLLLVGDGGERGRLEKLAAELKIKQSVIFAGVRHDIPRLLQALNIFALSSLSEGLPIAVLEAMSAGLPIVATNVGTLPELVTEGENGFLVAPQAPAAMAERLANLLANAELAREFGARGRRRVEAHYSLDVMLQRYAELYETLHCRRN